ncbi:MAG TPA: hypothetical protein PLV87_13200, partial [Opitutaceae bacterium]|nr:hypothetical protein [Opitutaceae bacterium]
MNETGTKFAGEFNRIRRVFENLSIGDDRKMDPCSPWEAAQIPGRLSRVSSRLLAQERNDNGEVQKVSAHPARISLRPLS